MEITTSARPKLGWVIMLLPVCGNYNNKELSDRRDSARRRSLRRSSSFQVINFGTNQKSVRDFQLANNINLGLHHISRRFQFSRSVGQNIAFDRRGGALVNGHVFGNLCEYRHKSYTAKNYTFGLHFSCLQKQIGVSQLCDTFSVTTHKTAIMPLKVVQGHRFR